MNRTPVVSSNLKSVGYDPAKKLLEVEFQNGATWHYHGVEPHQHTQLLAAKSIGSHFHAHIRMKHTNTPAETPHG